MYRLENGILHRDGKPVFGLGVSYYASYHPQKVPVPETGDRLGEMEKDLRDLREAGFNTVRMAALGSLRRADGRVEVEFPLVDTFLRQCEELGIAAMVRLQGYDMNMSGYGDYLMLDHNGEPMPFHWGWFVRNCVNHPGVIRDNLDGTLASARHFASFPALVGFQIYNEPAYPTKGIYCYNPHSIEAFRRQTGGTEPPRRRPERGADVSAWVRWRLFCAERLNEFLCRLSDTAKQGHPSAETFTCNMPCPVVPGNAIRCEDYFAVSERMDIHGITHYVPSRGATYHQASMILDAAESAAAVFGKHAWLIEYNARTKLELSEWERETYNAIGSAFKGILYYQWRADYPFENSPEPEGFGLLYSDRRKTEKYDGAVGMNVMLNRVSSLLACAEKVRSGAAILYSNHSVFTHDALDNAGLSPEDRPGDRLPSHMLRMYTSFRSEGAALDFVRAEDLKSNRLGLRLVLLPSLIGLDDQERTAVGAWVKGGGAAAVFDDWTGWYRLTDGVTAVDTGRSLDCAALCQELSIKGPLELRGQTRYVDAKLLKGRVDGNVYWLVALVNYDEAQRPVPRGGLSLRLDLGSLAVRPRALFIDTKVTTELEVASDGGRIRVELPETRTGGLVLIGAPLPPLGQAS